MNNTAAIVVTHNRKQMLLACVAGLLRQTCRRFDIWVVDNASTDGTEVSLRGYIDGGQIRYFNTGGNLGGAGGFHFSIREAARAGYEWFWIMDDDAVPEPSALEKLMEAAHSCGDFGFLSSRTLWTDGSLCRMNIQRDTRMKKISDFSGPLIPAGAATFVSLLLPARVVYEVGLPIPEFFIWADDLEYTRRISRKYPCYVVANSVVVHHCAANIGGNIALDDETRIERYRYAYRNEVYLYRREGLRGILHLLLRTPLHIARVIARSKSKKMKRIGVILGGTLRGIGFNPEIEKIAPPGSKAKEDKPDV